MLEIATKLNTSILSSFSEFSSQNNENESKSVKCNSRKMKYCSPSYVRLSPRPCWPRAVATQHRLNAQNVRTDIAQTLKVQGIRTIINFSFIISGNCQYCDKRKK